MKDDTMTADDFMGTVFSRNDGPDMLWDAWISKKIRPETLSEVIADIWCDAEWPQQCLTPQWAWVRLFRAAGYTSDGEPAAPPAGPVRLYRGCTPRYVRRMAWSADRGVAQWFADRSRLFGNDAYVYATDVPRDTLLCYLGDSSRYRGENEHVVDPSCLGKVWRVAA